VHGFLVVDKPLGISSRDAVNRVQAALPKDVRVGHTGTLDPLATGVLVLALGQGTRLTDYVQAQTKEYRASVRFGATSATDDAEGPFTPTPDARFPSRDELLTALAEFVGSVSQTPPTFSAAHVDGRRAYRLARQGKTVELKPKSVRIDRIDLGEYRSPDAFLTIQCGKGTYIRSIARDLGQRLGCGAYLTSLRRTRIGAFLESQAISIDGSAASFPAALRPLKEAVVGMTRVNLTADEIRRLGMGQLVATDSAFADGSEIAVFDDVERLRALATVEGKRLRPAKVFLCANE
jgi:tRNA pseudouridine55 synthase